MANRASIVLDSTSQHRPLSFLGTVAVCCALPFILIKLLKPHPPHVQQISTPPVIKPVSPSPVVVSPSLVVAPKITPPTRVKAAAPKPTVSPHLTVTVRRGDSLEKMFKRVGLSKKNLQEVMSAKPQTRLLTHLKPNQKLEFVIKDHRLETLLFPYSIAETLVISRTQQHYRTSINKTPTTSRRQSVAATIRGSLYTTARRKQIPYRLVQQMTNILSREIDFKKGIRTGDHFDILYEERYIDDKLIGIGEVLAVSYTNRGITHEAVRYTNRDGSTNYYTPQGLSLKKAAYDRYPVRFSHIGSPFSLSRYHPILHYRRPHYGIDLVAPIGTAIHAIGDGRIETMNWQKGYGNMVKINHNSMYSTIYGHLLRFEKGLYKGKVVKRGQVIGYVGQSGLASGPHCHFEFHKYHRPINPTTIELPHADPVPHREMAKFKTTAHRFLSLLRTKKSEHG